MKKSTLIKDHRNGEIEDLYATRSEMKAMADQIEQMQIILETQQKVIEELKGKVETQVQQSSDYDSKRRVRPNVGSYGQQQQSQRQHIGEASSSAAPAKTLQPRLCYACGLPGHEAKECPNSPSRPSRSYR